MKTMADFIELHYISNNEPRLINIDSIAYVKPAKEGSYLHLSSVLCNTSNCYTETIHIKESYQLVKAKLKEYE